MSRPCTERQASFLAENGFNPDQFDFDSASRQIDQIIQNNPRPGGQRRGNNQGGYGGNNYNRRSGNYGGNRGGQGNYRGQSNGGGRSYGGRTNGGGQGNYGNRSSQGGPPRDPNAPASPRQREILGEYGYDPNITMAQASDIIGALKANNWEPLNDSRMQAPPVTQTSGYGNGGGNYADPNELPWS